MTTKYAFSLLFILTALSGCAGDDAIELPQRVDVDQMKPATSRQLAEALNGGILPKATFDTLSRRDKMRVLLTEYSALENSPAGKALSWQNPNGKFSGIVTPLQPFKVGTQNCRQYSHDILVRDVQITASGAACRSPNGKWVPIQ